MTCAAKLYIYIGVGPRELYIDEAHRVLDIFPFAVFLNSNISYNSNSKVNINFNYHIYRV